MTALFFFDGAAEALRLRRRSAAAFLMAGVMRFFARCVTAAWLGRGACAGLVVAMTDILTAGAWACVPPLEVPPVTPGVVPVSEPVPLLPHPERIARTITARSAVTKDRTFR